MGVIIDGENQEAVGEVLDLDIAGGIMRIGAFIIQWGSGTSTKDGIESFTFNEDFPTACFSVTLQRISYGVDILPVENISASGWDIDRSDVIDGSPTFYWFAIGY